jgi:hypothetical protein
MAKFLSTQEIYRLLQRELPEKVDPDGAPSAFYKTASMWSKADVAATGYANLRRVYENFWPQSSEEQIDEWVVKMFGSLFGNEVDLAQKRERVIAKIRKQPNITEWEILKIVSSYVPPGTYVQVYAPCGDGTTPGDQQWWTLGVSMLGIDTYLRGLTVYDLGIDPSEWCNFLANLHWRLGDDLLGFNTYLSEFKYMDIFQVQANAYLYEIRIFGYEVTGQDLLDMQRDVDMAEPARSAYRLRQNLDLNDFGLNNIVPNVDQFSLVNCITRDSGSTTGFTGRTV